MNLDVVFVLDASGSMNSSDPNKIAIDAFNLFLDLSDETCGMGYSIYTEKIIASNPIVSLNDPKNIDTLKKSISDIYKPYGYTDIALGLTDALNIHLANKDADSSRKKAVILLSDGNTQLMEGSSRTLEDAQKEMESTLKSLNQNNIPVYSIGLNYDNKLDRKELKNISDKTNGKTYETNTSDELISIMSDIFSDIYKLGGKDCEIIDGNVEINIKDNSVFYVNIIIQSTLGVDVLNPVLTDPDGKTVSLTGDDDNIKMTSTGSYTLIKIIYPKSGIWNLHLDKADKNNCKIRQLDFYSVFVLQSITRGVSVGEKINIESSLNNRDGIVNDHDLLKTITMKAVISKSNGDTEIELERQVDGTYTGAFTADIEGEYTIKTIAISESFEKESNISKVNVISGLVTPSETSDAGDSGSMPTILFIGCIFLLSIIGIIVLYMIVHLAMRHKVENQKTEPVPEAPPPPPPPEPKPILPKPKDPEYVNIPIIEHADLESLIKKGPEDAFNTNPDMYQADPTVEALVKKKGVANSVVKENLQ